MERPELSVSRPALKALFQKIRSEEKLSEILQDFYQRMSEDILIGYFFTGKNLEEIAKTQKAFLLRAMGVLPTYQGKPPAQAHAQLPPILKGHFDRRLRILEDTLKDHGLDDLSIQTWLGFEEAFRDGIIAESERLSK